MSADADTWPAVALKALTTDHGSVVEEGSRVVLLEPISDDERVWVAEVKLGDDYWDTLEVNVETDVEAL